MDIDVSKLTNLLSHALIGNTVHFLEEIGSTNVHAAELARAGAPEGAVVIADRQLSGKGRLNRSWQSPPGRNVYASIVLRPKVSLAESTRVTLAVGIAAAETIAAYCAGAVRLKWPNDVQVRGRKICGILSEMQGCGDQPEFIIVGIGVNINMQKADFQEELREIATSLREETGREIDRTDFIIRLLWKFERWYRIFLSGDFEAVRQRWIQLSQIIGKSVRVASGEKIESGKVIGMDDRGALLLLDDDDKIREILAGDVSLREAY
jgi:BirA family biotin operon repressor/biotin-[acetyl-CoA-carboxylase] ligase